MTANTLGGTLTMAGDLTVNRMGYGAMQLAGPGVMGPPKDRGEAIAVLRTAVELGVNHIDTAGFYGPDVTNEIIREALAPYDGVHVVTKVGYVRDTAGDWLPARRPEQLREQVESNLRTLGLEALDVVNLRFGDRGQPLARLAGRAVQRACRPALARPDQAPGRQRRGRRAGRRGAVNRPGGDRAEHVQPRLPQR